MCHTYHNPRNQLPFPFQVKKNKKKTKKHKKTKKNKKPKNKNYAYHNPRNQLPFPFQVKKKNKKKQKTQKQELRMRIFLGYHMDWKDRNVTYIYSFEPNTVSGCQGDSDDVNTPN